VRLFTEQGYDATTVEQIAAAARDGVRLPQKTTFFHPKLRTGLVFRFLDR
jgi:AcrR family transcriptional regulator